MNRKITRLARGAKCASGAALLAAAILGSIPARPTMPKPAHMRCNICRRLSATGSLLPVPASLVHINRLAANQHHLGILLPPAHARLLGAGEKFPGHLIFFRPRF